VNAGEYLGQEDFSISVRPGRCAYLIADGSQSGFKRAVREASSRWGGMSEPILPVAEDGHLEGLWVQILDFADVDELINVDVESEVAENVASVLGIPLVPLTDIDRSGPGQFTCNPISIAFSQASPDPTYQFALSQHVGMAWVGADDSLDLWSIVATCLQTVSLGPQIYSRRAQIIAMRMVAIYSPTSWGVPTTLTPSRSGSTSRSRRAGCHGSACTIVVTRPHP
jgi:hypothetical protein